MAYLNLMPRKSHGAWPGILKALEKDPNYEAEIKSMFDGEYTRFGCIVEDADGGRVSRVRLTRNGYTVRTSLRSVLYLLHTGRLVMLRPATTCRNKNCVNPLHQIEMTSNDPEAIRRRLHVVNAAGDGRNK